MKFEIEDFRRFHKPSQAEIAPITVLVGENSSGKTSFLAGFRYIIQSMSFGDEGSFNREPFFLGAYDQIAHYRGGRFGRSDHFTLGLHLNEGEVEQFLPDNGPIRYISYPFQGKKLEASHSVSKLYFSNDQSQPILQKVFLANKYVSINMKRDALPIFDITRIDNKDEIAISANEPVLYYAHASTIINRNSLGPYIQSIKNWMYTNRLTHQKRGKIDKKETEFLELVGKAVLPTYAFPDKAIYASAPFRTKPERTYSPVEASSSVEGSHIPILLAQAKAFERNKWSRIK